MEKCVIHKPADIPWELAFEIINRANKKRKHPYHRSKYGVEIRRFPNHNIVIYKIYNKEKTA